MRVPTYTFTLRSDGRDVNDDVGIALTDNASAYRYARTVARELMRSRETQGAVIRHPVRKRRSEPRLPSAGTARFGGKGKRKKTCAEGCRLCLRDQLTGIAKPVSACRGQAIPDR